MIDLTKEQGLSLAETASTWPSKRPGTPTHISRPLRAILKGTPLPDGSRVRLEAIRLGDQWITTARAIREYGERIAAAHILAEDDVPTSRPTAARKREVSRAGAELDKLGI